MLQTRIRSKTDTTANWNLATSFVPLQGEIVIYSDYETKVVDGNTIRIPNFKVGDGNAYVVDLPFVNDDLRDELLAHTTNSNIHVTAAEKLFWNEKVRCYMDVMMDDGVLVETEELIFTTD